MSDNHTISMFFVLVIVEVLWHPLFRCQANSCSWQLILMLSPCVFG